MLITMILVGLVGVIVLFCSWRVLSHKKIKIIKCKHVIITGGSSGIGKSLAKLCIQKGADVSIIARDKIKLESAKKELSQCVTSMSQQITVVSADTSNYQVTESEIQKLEKNIGPTFMLINCVGMAICGKLENMSVEEINTQVSANLYGTIYPIKAIISKMKEREEGIIVLTSSQGGLVGIFGMSVYACTKFGIRGFAEALDMEVRPYNISVTVALPPDTDTPGFERENIGKPRETSLICESAGLFHPDRVAERILTDSLEGTFFSYIGFESFITTTLCVGMSPFSSFLEVFYQSFLIGPIRIISAFYLKKFHCIIKNETTLE